MFSYQRSKVKKTKNPSTANPNIINTIGIPISQNTQAGIVKAGITKVILISPI